MLDKSKRNVPFEAPEPMFEINFLQSNIISGLRANALSIRHKEQFSVHFILRIKIWDE